MKAKDIMTKEILSVEKDIPVYEAVQIMNKNNIGSRILWGFLRNEIFSVAWWPRT